MIFDKICFQFTDQIQQMKISTCLCVGPSQFDYIALV